MNEIVSLVAASCVRQTTRHHLFGYYFQSPQARFVPKEEAIQAIADQTEELLMGSVGSSVTSPDDKPSSSRTLVFFVLLFHWQGKGAVGGGH